MYTFFETDRLNLRATHLEDAEFVLKILNMPKWKLYIGDRNVHTKEEASDYIKERMLPQLERIGYGNYTMIRKSDGAKIGLCGLYDREGLDGVDIGFATLPAFEGKGYTYEAASFILEKAFDTFNLNQVQGITSKKNIASQHLLEKLGLKNMGEVHLPGDEEALYLFQINRS